MNKILVPIDLKHNDEIALNLASKLTTGQSTEIVLLHIIPAPNDGVLLADGRLKEDGDLDFSELRVKANDTLVSLKNQYSSIENISVDVQIGNINTIILSLTNSGDFDLLVIAMENHLSHGFWSESHTEHISKHSKIPVLTLKCDRSSIDLSKIVYVGDFLTTDDLNLQVLRDLSATFNSKITLLKIVNTDQTKHDEIIANLADNFALKNELKNYEFQIQYGITVEDGVAKYCETNKVDLIAIGSNQRDGFSTLFRKSISQNVVKKLYHPIIMFPIN